MTSLPVDSETPSSEASRSEQIQSVVIFVAILWGVYFIDLLLPWDLTTWGVEPRKVSGLVGILFMPFLHAGFGHLLSNTVPLTVLLFLVSGTRKNAWGSIVAISLLGGLLLWLFGRSAEHVGASGLVYGLAGFLIVIGVLEKKIVSLLIALLVVVVFGTSLFWGLLPLGNRGVSWDGHLLGGVAGACVAWLSTRNVRQAPLAESV